jgi:parallel beta-helix repeat protein
MRFTRASLVVWWVVALNSLPVAGSASAQPAPPLLPSKITASQTLKRAEYLRPNSSDDGKTAAVEIVGDNLTVDFGNAVLRGTPATTEPDERRGTGVRIRGKNITVRNLRVHGYKIAVIAENCPNLKLENCDLSYNWKQRLKSTQEREDVADWMSFHRNENNEWLRYGAGIYLRNCDNFVVKNCRIVGGQCGLMLTGCDKGLAYNNNFSFLSAIGLGMYQSSENRILHNNIDWCVRGYSHGVYNRGQDSAGILIYEQSHKNIFAYNSVTHGGDGFFLWAGQTTMETGKGGCNDNLLYGNDFSHAPTNGIEATFSRNNFVNNLIMECWHGIWGGFSYNTNIIGNTFAFNAQGIAIEHGQENAIVENIFHRNVTAIALWQNPTVDPNFGYAKNRDTKSRDYRISNNRFTHHTDSVLNLRDTTGVRVFGGNFVAANAKIAVTTGKTEGFELPEVLERDKGGVPYPAVMEPSGNVVVNPLLSKEGYLNQFVTDWKPFDFPLAKYKVAPLADGKKPFLKPGTLRGRRYIVVDEWGPYDFQRPILWLRGTGRTPKEKRFEILGPQGKWRVKSLSPGVTLSARSGVVPGEVVATLPEGGKGSDIRIQLEYVGAKTTDYRGVVTPAGKPVSFGYSLFFVPIQWEVAFYLWQKEGSDPRTQPEAFATLLSGKPLVTLTTDRLDFAGRFTRGVPPDYFATVAEGKFEITPGEYLLEFITDDGLRVSLDGKPLITDAWKYQGPTPYSATVKLGGKHTLKVEHFQIDGYATLKMNLRPAKR